MLRSQYDHDVSIWSPQGRIHQIEYAMEAVNQGTAVIAVKNKDHAIIVALKRAPSELSSYQEKIIHIDDHIGVAISGLTADGRVLSRSMRRECCDNRWAYDQPLPVSRMLDAITLKMQIPTQRYGRRPFGVGMLVIGYDSAGPHVYYLCPSSNAYNCKCFAIGLRSQSARTYMERHSNEFSNSSLDQLMMHGIKALASTLPNEVSLNEKNCSIAIVGKGMNFKSYNEDDVGAALKSFEATQVVTVAATSGSSATPMDEDSAYVTSTQFSNWYFTVPELLKLRSKSNLDARTNLLSRSSDSSVKMVSGLDVEQELKIVKRYIFLMKVLFDKFTKPKLPFEVYGFAATYFKRFYLKHSVMDFYPRDIMLTCLYVACKAADFPIGIQTFVSQIPRNQERYSYFILNSELFLLESLNYDLWIFTPYRALIGFITELIAYQKRVQLNQKNSDQANMNSTRSKSQLIEELIREGTYSINLWFQTDLCLTVNPSQIALAALVELGRTRPQLDVEVFVRDELCGCDPIDKFKPNIRKVTESDDEDDDLPTVKVKVDSALPPTSTNKVDPDSRWHDLSNRLDFIRQTVDDFQFITDLEPLTEDERLLEQCRNPLYNLDSQEYADAKCHADNLMATLE